MAEKQDPQEKAAEDLEKTIVRLDQRKRILKGMIKAYQNQLDILAEKFRARDTLAGHQDVLNSLAEMHKFFMDLQATIEYNKAVKGQISVESLEEKLEGIIQNLRRLMIYIQDFETFREKYLQGIIRRKKVPA